MDGYNLSEKKLYCNGCFASGINFGASLISLFYGEGDFKDTVRLATLMGWDSDNPAATWGGMLGFMYGRKLLEAEFDSSVSDRFNIHRTRRNFADNGLDDFPSMADKGMAIINRVVLERLQGESSLTHWAIPSVHIQSELDDVE